MDFIMKRGTLFCLQIFLIILNMLSSAALLSNTESEDFSSSAHASIKHGQKQRKTLSKRPNIYYSLAWTVKKSKMANEPMILFETVVDTDVNWIGFGIAGENEDDEPDMLTADWFIAWKGKNKHIHFKDCNAIEDSLHFDKSQDYHVISEGRPNSLNLTVKRLLDTNDEYDLKIKTGKMHLLWAYGYANRFSKIRSDIGLAERDEDIVFFSAFQKDTVASSSPPNLKRHQIKSQVKDEKQKAKTKDSDLHVKKAEQQAIKFPSKNSSDVATRKTNCTVIIEKKTYWYEILRLKQKNIYYAIIGCSALLASLIVFILACCCAKKSTRSAASKVAFYKVDDYDDEQVEFLKERA